MIRRRPVVASLAVALLLVTSIPAEAAPAFDLPSAVRINISGDGTSYAVFASTATLVVKDPAGAELYRGIGRVLARTGVYRLEGGAALPPRPAPGDVEGRLNRAILLREAQIEARHAPGTLVRVPFEVSQLRDLDDDMGKPVYSSDRVRGIRLEAVGGGLLTFNGRAYRGTLELADDDGEIQVINTVATDRYLVSVVGSEVPTDWHRQALAAQAIAARTYLLRRLGSHGHYDLEGDERDQAYNGYRGETDSTERAVRDTAGIVATYRGAAIETFYSANAGGVTENSEDVWVTPLPYLRSVPSPADRIALQSSWGWSSYEWTKEYTEPGLRAQLLRNCAVAVGFVRSIDILERSVAGGVLRARVRGSFGSRDILKDSARWCFGVRSQLFSVAFTEADEREVVPVDLPQNDPRRGRLAEVEGLGSEREAVVVTTETGVADGTPAVVGLKTSAHLYRLPARVVFSGKGYGHRVGMSQWGMHGMALQGSSYEQILKHYYRGIALTKIAGP